MEKNEELVKLPMKLGSIIAGELKKKKKYTKRLDKNGFLSYEYTREELELITSLQLVNPTSGTLKGVELLPNLRTLTVSSQNTAYTDNRSILSITDEDAISISQCENLEQLEITGQARISFLDVSRLSKLKVLNISRNIGFEEIIGLEKLKNIFSLTCVGNEALLRIKNLDRIILNNPELFDIHLDLLLFPDAIGLKNDFSINDEALEKILNSTVTWEEVVGKKNTKINNNQMLLMHKKACEAIRDYLPKNSPSYTTVMGIERFLAENVKYDDTSLKHDHRHMDGSHTYNGKTILFSSGAERGANGAFNALIHHTCVCEGFTRAMQYLLRLKGISSRNVNCLGVPDTIHISDYNNKNARFTMPNDGFHSIICIEGVDCLYCDPCWDAELYQHGVQNFPYALLTKEEISRDHTLSFEERNVNNGSKVSRKEIEKELLRIEEHIKERKGKSY